MKMCNAVVGRLAVLGGAPLFDVPLHVGRPNIADRAALMPRIEDILDRRWLTNSGPFVEEFESRICELTGAANCIAMCNATVALEIAIRALGLHGEVIVPSFTFIATAHALQWQKITPVFCDIDPQSHTLDPACVERMITPRTTGIVGVHLWGRPCEVEALQGIADKHNLTLMFDAAHAFACSHNGTMIGNFGKCEVFSFHATKFMNTLEGGAVVTNSDELAAKIRLMQNFGFAGLDNVVYIGTNGKMNEVSAAFGITGFESLEKFIGVNRTNYETYRQCLDGIPGVGMVEYSSSNKCNYHYVVLEIDENLAGISRDTLIGVLYAENVLARRYFYPGCHRMEPYRSHFPHAGLLLPNTERVAARVLSLPTGTGVTCEDIRKICGILRLAVEESEEVNRTLAGRAEEAGDK